MKKRIRIFKYITTLGFVPFDDAAGSVVVVCPLCSTTNRVSKYGGMCLGMQPMGRKTPVLHCMVSFDVESGS